MGKWNSTRLWVEQWTTLPPPLKSDLTNKTILIAGANKGIGLETAKTLAKQNPKRLILACRNETRGKDALEAIAKEANYKAELGLVDFEDFNSVIDFAGKYKDDPVDILILNAAIVTMDYKLTKDGWESGLQVNYLSLALLTLLLVPALVRTAQSKGTISRVVFVSSYGHYLSHIGELALDAPNILQRLNDPEFCALPYIMALRYCDTKLFGIFFVRALTERLPIRQPLVPTAVDPGYCVSDIRNNVHIWRLTLTWALQDRLMARTPEQGARQVVLAALGPDGREGKHAHLFRGMYISTQAITEPSDFAMSKEGRETQDRIWDETIEILTKAAPEVDHCLKAYLTATLP